MTERKMWSPEEDRIIIKYVRENDKKPEESKWKWSDIADLLHKDLPSSKRTGKQCRERWHNQLDPSIERDKQWTKEQIDKLFELQDEHGNRWAAISREMPGRTDNNIKNFFYSSLRRAIRQTNLYVSQYKKKSNIKPFKQTILTKILNISDEKYRDKLDIKKDSAQELANDLKNMLARLSQETEDKELDEQDMIFREKIVKSIQQFNKSCKKRKTKRVETEEEPDIQILEQYRQTTLKALDSERQNKKQKQLPSNKKTIRKVSEVESKITKNGKKNGIEMNKKKSKIEQRHEEPQKLKKRKSQVEQLIQMNPQLNKLILQKNSSSKQKLQKLESKASSRQGGLELFKKSNGFSFLQNDNIPDLPISLGMITRRSSMQNRDIKFNEPAWPKKDSLPMVETFDMGNGVVNPLMGESYNFGELNERMGNLQNKASFNDSGFMKLFKQPSKTEHSSRR